VSASRRSSGSVGDHVLAHGVGGAADLPIPAGWAVTGGAAALALTFVVLLLAWRTPRFAGAAERAVPGLDRVVSSTAFVVVVRLVGLVATAYVVMAAVWGADLRLNPVFGVVYVLLWVGLVPASLLLGPVVRALSPLRTVHVVLSRLTGGDPAHGLVALPRWLGYWPAAIGLLAFVWLELVHPEQTYLTPVRVWFACYAGVMLVGAAVFGDRWFARADPFEVYSSLVAHLSPWGRTDDGTLVVRNPLRNLRSIPVEPGLVAVVGVLLGSTAFDSFREAPVWRRVVQDLPSGATWVNTGVLVAFCAGVAVAFWAATVAVPPRAPWARRDVPGLLAHSVVPIILGYMVAHYASLLVEYGQQTVIYLSDPLVRGDDLLGTADLTVAYVLSSRPGLLATLKVVAIVLGHLLGVLAAHDRSLELLDERRRVSGQLPLLAVMVAFTFGGLWLLFGI
jgi:hypothetical protein